MNMKLKSQLLLCTLLISSYADAQSYDKEFLRDFAKEMNKSESEMLQLMTIKAKSNNLTINQAMWESCRFARTGRAKIDCKRIEGK